MPRAHDADPIQAPAPHGSAGRFHAGRFHVGRFHAGLAALLAALLLVPAPTFAAGRGPGPGGSGGPGFFGDAAEGEEAGFHRRLPLRRLAGFLDLTEAQVDEARAILETARTAADPLRAERRALASQLREALDAAEPDPAAVGAPVIELHDNREALRGIFGGAIEDFLAILTPEQRERFETLGDARRTFGRGHHRGHHRGPHRGGPGSGGPGPGGTAAGAF